MSLINWPDTSDYGFVLRGAYREGHAPRVVVIPTEPTETLADDVKESRLRELGFVLGGGAWSREAKGLSVPAIFAQFPRTRLAPIERDALYSAPWPEDTSPLGRLQKALDEHRGGEHDDHATIDALAAAVQSRLENLDDLRERWLYTTVGAWEIGELPADKLAAWMEGQLRTEAIGDPDGAAEGASSWPEWKASKSAVMLKAEAERWELRVQPQVRQLDRDELRARDVEQLLGTTPRVTQAFECIRASRRALGTLREALADAIAERQSAAVDDAAALFSSLLSGGATATRVPSGAVGFESDESWRRASLAGREGWLHPRGHFIDFSGQSEPKHQSDAPAVLADAKVTLGDVRLRPLAQFAGRTPPKLWIFEVADDPMTRVVVNASYAQWAVQGAPGGEWRIAEPVPADEERPIARYLQAPLVYVVEGELKAVVMPMQPSAIDLFEEGLARFRERGIDSENVRRLAADGGAFRGKPADVQHVDREAIPEGFVSACVPDARFGSSPIFLRLPADYARRSGEAADLAAAVAGSTGEGEGETWRVELLPDRVVVADALPSIGEALEIGRVSIKQAAAEVPSVFRVPPEHSEMGVPEVEIHVPWHPARAAAYGADHLGEDPSALIALRAGLPLGERPQWLPVARGMVGDAWQQARIAEAGLMRVEGLRDPFLAQAPAALEATTSPVEDGDRAGNDSAVVSRHGDAAASNDADETAANSNRIEDFGEKIGGARKDLAGLAGRALRVEQTDDWTTEELREHLTRDTLWPFDFNKRIEAGVSPVVAQLEQGIRNYVRPCYEDAGSRRRGAQRRLWDDAEARKWAEGVGLVHALFDGAKTLDDVEARARVLWAGGAETSRAALARSSMKRVISWIWVDHLGFNGAQGRAVARTRIEQWAAYELSRREVRTQVRDEKKSVRAERGKAEGPERAPRIEVRAHLAHVQRSGPDVRQGEDATPEMFASRFQFRGGEFGNWLGQKERQEVLNLAFDGLSDLAGVLGVPEQAIGLSGEMAIAFGARGIGGRKAALAHYEPGRRVINLTRMSGAGSLAHEFAHAFDHYLERISSRGAGEHTYASEHVQQRSDGYLERVGFRPEIIAALRRVNQAIWYRERSPDEVAQFNAAFREDLRSKAVAEIDAYRPALIALGAGARSAEGPLTREDAVAVEDILAKRDAVLGAVDSARAVFEIKSAPLDVVEKARLTLEEALPLTETLFRLQSALSAKGLIAGGTEQVRYSYPALKRAPRAYARSLAGNPFLERKYQSSVSESYFWQAAREIDAFERRKKPYWNTQRELFARAFESWVFDRLVESGHRSDYLVHGVEDKGVDVVGMAARGEQLLLAYPVGEDRKAINAAFDGLAKALKTGLEPDGTVRLYQRGVRPAGAGLSVPAVTAVVQPLLEGLKTRLQVIVVDHVDELPHPAPGDVRGAFTQTPVPTVWLVASNLADAKAVETTLAHEVVRHAGVFALLGESRERVLEQIWADHPAVREHADALRAGAFAEGHGLSRADAIEEALAELADASALVQLSSFGRLVACVRSALRTAGFGGLVGRWTDNDVAYLMSNAARATGLEALGAGAEHSVATPLRAVTASLTLGVALNVAVSGAVAVASSAAGPAHAVCGQVEIDLDGATAAAQRRREAVVAVAALPALHAGPGTQLAMDVSDLLAAQEPSSVAAARELAAVVRAETQAEEALAFELAIVDDALVGAIEDSVVAHGHWRVALIEQELDRVYALEQQLFKGEGEREALERQINATRLGLDAALEAGQRQLDQSIDSMTRACQARVVARIAEHSIREGAGTAHAELPSLRRGGMRVASTRVTAGL